MVSSAAPADALPVVTPTKPILRNPNPEGDLEDIPTAANLEESPSSASSRVGGWCSRCFSLQKPVASGAVAVKDVEGALRVTESAKKVSFSPAAHAVSPAVEMDRKSMNQEITLITREDLQDFASMMQELQDAGTDNMKVQLPERRLALNRRLVMFSAARAAQYQNRGVTV